MDHYDLILLFLRIGLMLAVALVCGHIMRKLHQPAVLGELMGGIFLGPTVFGALFPEQAGWLFPIENATLDALIRLGMLFFLFVAGLEVNLAQVRQKGLAVTLTSLLGILVPFSLGFGAVLLLPTMWGSYSSARLLLLALFLGTALSISALPVIARILLDLGLIKKEIGLIVMTAATLNDLVGWSLFALILSALTPGGPAQSPWQSLGLVLGFFALLPIVGRWIGPRLLRWAHTSLAWPSGFIGLITVLMMLAAAAAETLGLHAIFGAFLLGVALARYLEGENQAREIIHQFAVSFFAPLYFVSIGLKANFAANFDLPLALVVLVIACLGKIGGAGLGAWLGGLPLGSALAIGFGMNARGAMEIILASVALEYKLIDDRIFVALVIMALITSLISGPCMQQAINRANQAPFRVQPAPDTDSEAKG